MEFFWKGDAEFSVGCLYLNAWTPAGAEGVPGRKIPVAIWIHGGAYSGGWGFEIEMEGEAWAEREVILIIS
jgi:para-nitrobenzyl esterase